jgi:hypothetical protein
MCKKNNPATGSYLHEIHAHVFPILGRYRNELLAVPDLEVNNNQPNGSTTSSVVRNMLKPEDLSKQL